MHQGLLAPEWSDVGQKHRSPQDKHNKYMLRNCNTARLEMGENRLTLGATG